MDKRKVPRFKRRIQLRFWSLDDRNPRKGFTHNVSVAGMFIASTAPFKPGTRIFVEVPSGSEKLVLQAVVRYAARVDPVLQKVKPSGMVYCLINPNHGTKWCVRIDDCVTQSDA